MSPTGAAWAEESSRSRTRTISALASAWPKSRIRRAISEYSSRRVMGASMATLVGGTVIFLWIRGGRAGENAPSAARRPANRPSRTCPFLLLFDPIPNASSSGVPPSGRGGYAGGEGIPGAPSLCAPLGCAELALPTPLTGAAPPSRKETTGLRAAAAPLEPMGAMPMAAGPSKGTPCVVGERFPATAPPCAPLCTIAPL